MRRAAGDDVIPALWAATILATPDTWLATSIGTSGWFNRDGCRRHRVSRLRLVHLDGNGSRPLKNSARQPKNEKRNVRTWRLRCWTSVLASSTLKATGALLVPNLWCQPDCAIDQPSEVSQAPSNSPAYTNILLSLFPTSVAPPFTATSWSYAPSTDEATMSCAGWPGREVTVQPSWILEFLIRYSWSWAGQESGESMKSDGCVFPQSDC